MSVNDHKLLFKLLRIYSGWLRRLQKQWESETDTEERERLYQLLHRHAHLKTRLTAIASGRMDGSAGSGNWGHEGRPGEVGGSASGGGVHNRFTDKSGKFTSFAKDKKAAATPHKVSMEELKAAPIGTKLVTHNGSVFTKNQHDDFVDAAGHFKSKFSICTADENFSLAIPNSASPNWQKQTYTDEGLSESRKASALKTSDRAVVDDALRSASGEAWNKCSAAEKKALDFLRN